MCIGGKKKGSSGPTATAPAERVNPRDPEYGPGMFRDPDAMMSMIAGVFTNARGVTDPVNKGRIRLGGGSLLPAIAAPAATTSPASPPSPPAPPKPPKPAVNGGGGGVAGEVQRRVPVPVGGFLPWAFAIKQMQK